MNFINTLPENLIKFVQFVSLCYMYLQLLYILLIYFTIEKD